MKTKHERVTSFFTQRKLLLIGAIVLSVFVAGCAGTIKQEQVSSTYSVQSSATAPVPNQDRTAAQNLTVLRHSALESIDDEPEYNGGQFTILRENSEQQIFRDYGVNPTISTDVEAVSTFAMDVDTVSYRIARQSIESQRLPSKASVRVEEFINHFDYNYRSSGDDFSISAEIVPSPFRPGFHVLHVGIKAKNVPNAERLPANLVLVADVSGSMGSQNKMDLQQKAFVTLVSQLKSDDKVAIVAYEDNARVVLKPTSAKYKSKIYRAIKRLRPGGSTNAASGIRKGYELADQMAYPGHINRVILTSDGLANIGEIEPKQILSQIEDYKKRNIFLTTVGVGQQMYNDYLLEQLANKGNGQYLYFADTNDIQSAFVDGLTTQLQVVAKDAKVQIKFDPTVVSHFRQIGYENRALETEDFLDGEKDGGELGANHQVTVLYEIKLRDNLQEKNVAKMSVSYKRPQGSAVFVLDKDVPQVIVRQSIESASPDTMVAITSAAFAEKLRQSYWSRLYDYNDIHSELKGISVSKLRNPKVQELVRLVSLANRLDKRVDQYEARYPLERINYEQVPLLK